MGGTVGGSGKIPCDIYADGYFLTAMISTIRETRCIDQMNISGAERGDFYARENVNLPQKTCAKMCRCMLKCDRRLFY